jgi:flagellar M-ring protein FliF
MLPITLPPALEPLVLRLGGPRRAAIAAVGLATVLLILGLSRWATAPTFVPLFSAMPLETSAEVTQRLREEGISFRLEQGGTQVLVASTDVARARVSLAQGGLPTSGRPGLELFDQPSWGMTDFAQRINYRRALEGELERTIGKMRGVDHAQVHLALSEQSTFRAAERPVEASVVLRLRGGQTPTQDVVQGIQHLVASSVDGLENQKVTVLDESGRLLSIPDEPGSLAALSNRQLTVQREVESYLERRAEEMLAQVVGAGNVRVRVAATVNFDRVERTTESVDPDRQVVATEQRSEIIPGPQGGAGSTTTSANYENSRSMESFSGAIGNVKKLSVAVLVNEKPVADPAAAVAAGAVATEPRTDQELAQIEALVRGAVGADPARGDVVSVASLAFSSPAPLVRPAPDLWTILEQVQRPGLTLLALLIAAFVALRALRLLKQPEFAPVAAALAAGDEPVAALENPDAAGELEPGEETELLPAGEPDALELALRASRVPSANVRTRAEVVRWIEDQPDVAVRVVRSWLREA